MFHLRLRGACFLLWCPHVLTCFCQMFWPPLWILLLPHQCLQITRKLKTILITCTHTCLVPLKNRKIPVTKSLTGNLSHKGHVKRDNLQRWFLAEHHTAMLEQCCSYPKQRCNNVAILCYPKNCCCELSSVTITLRAVISINFLPSITILY